MNVKFAILGLLVKRPSYPYELSLSFKERVGSAWKLSRGQVYQTVDRLEKSGLIERIGSKPNGHGDRCVYRATKRGSNEFERWLMGSTEKIRPVRDELLLKIAMAKPEDADHLLRVIERQELLCRERLHEYTELLDSLVQLEEACRWKDVGPALSTEVAIAQLEMDMNWLAKVHCTLMRLRDGAEVTGRRRLLPQQREQVA